MYQLDGVGPGSISASGAGVREFESHLPDMTTEVIRNLLARAYVRGSDHKIALEDAYKYADYDLRTEKDKPST